MSDETPDTAATPPQTEAPGGRRSIRTVIVLLLTLAVIAAIAVAVVAIGQAGPGEAEAPITPRPTPTAQQPHPDAPQITEFVMLGENPRTQCLEPGRITATIELRWASSVDNEQTELWGYAIGRNTVGSELSSNGSHTVPIPCTLQQNLSFFVVVHDGEHSANAEVVVEPTATPRVDEFSVEVAGGGALADACASGGDVALELSWASTNAENVTITRIAQPGAAAGTVNDDALYTSSLETDYSCAWTSAEYTLTVTDRNGITSSSTVSIAR